MYILFYIFIYTYAYFILYYILFIFYIIIADNNYNGREYGVVRHNTITM